MSYRFSSKLERDLVRKVGRAVGDHDLIQAGDHLLLAVSGGKDSLAMLELLVLLRHRSPVDFSMTVVTVDQGTDAFSTEYTAQRCRHHGVEFKVSAAPIRQIVEEKIAPGDVPCPLCSRLRRGVLYNVAPSLGCNKIVLGHHLDDLIETLLLNLFFAGQLRSMAPRFQSDDGRNEVIRPLCYIEESWIIEYSLQRRFEVEACGQGGCAGENSRRLQMKRLVASLAETSTGIRGHALHALQNVRPAHLLDRELLRIIGS